MREKSPVDASRRWFALGRAASGRRVFRESGVQDFPGDLEILNVALGLEHQAVAAYRVAAASGLLSGDAAAMAASFQRDHERHRDSIVRLVRRFGGTPAAPSESYEFGDIGEAREVLELAHRLEQGAVDAYLANAAKLESSEVLDAAAGILADEVRHATAFKLALSLSVIERPKY